MKEFRAALDDFDIIWCLALVLQFMRAFLFFCRYTWPDEPPNDESDSSWTVV